MRALLKTHTFQPLTLFPNVLSLANKILSVTSLHVWFILSTHFRYIHSTSLMTTVYTITYDIAFEVKCKFIRDKILMDTNTIHETILTYTLVRGS
jgi:hypothetical protein